LKASSLSIERELSNLNYSQSEILVNFVKDFLPKSAFSQDLDSVSVHLFIKRLLFKCQVICQNIERYQITGSSADTFSVEEIEYFWSMKYQFANLADLAKDLDTFMDTTDVTNYLKLGTLHLELLPLESKLDAVIHLLKEEELTSGFPLEEIKTLVSKISHIHTTYQVGDSISTTSTLFQRKLHHLLYECNLLLLEEKRVQRILSDRSTNKTTTLDILNIPSLNTVRRCIEFIKKLSSSFKEYQPQESDVTSINDTLHNINQIIDQSRHLFKQISTYLLENLQDAREVQNNTLLESVAIVLKKLELDIDWNWLDLLFNAIHNNLKDTSDKLLNAGVAIVTNNNIDKSKKTPYIQRSDTVKTMLSDAVNLKSHLEEKNTEILEHKKTLQMKNNEIQELQWKEQALDKKIEKFLKNVHF
jgi:hypothetical protein